MTGATASTKPSTPQPPRPMERHKAMALIRDQIFVYIDSEYDGDLDRRGLKMQVKVIDNIGALLRWFAEYMECDLDDVRLLLMLSLVECSEADFDGFYPDVHSDNGHHN